MERKTNVHAEDGKQDILITREFDLPVELLFKAHTEAGILEQWMGTKVMKLEPRKNGSWHFRTSDPQGNVLFQATGVFHEVVPNQKMVRTFEMDNAPFDVQLDFIEFVKLTDDTSKLIMHSIFRSVAHRDQLLKMPFEYGVNMAHDSLQEIVGKLK